ncbi:hypothetical protein [Curtobacterium sp. MCJR17_043]|uniref:hypothetical protein n=1 Tax=Curtobacterium sp. MCJR17_043 TaxID=2175660 RepID=UPI0024DF3300|nr:hypothetical protein [Curtobacterium sp. MCJR17_043]WIB35157.1 hypothetical protein DEJ15_12195 [Curtobacterium sp. MCJR17_043]
MAGRDVDEATRFYERVHDAHEVRLTQDESRPFGFRFRAVGDDRLRLRSSALSADRWGRIEPVGRILVAWAHDGQLAFDAGADQELVAHAGVPAVYPTGRPFTIEAPAGITLHTIDVDARALEDLHAARTGTAPPTAHDRPTPGRRGPRRPARRALRLGPRPPRPRRRPPGACSTRGRPEPSHARRLRPCSGGTAPRRTPAQRLPSARVHRGAPR